MVQIMWLNLRMESEMVKGLKLTLMGTSVKGNGRIEKKGRSNYMKITEILLGGLWMD